MKWGRSEPSDNIHSNYVKYQNMCEAGRLVWANDVGQTVSQVVSSPPDYHNSNINWASLPCQHNNKTSSSETSPQLQIKTNNLTSTGWITITIPYTHTVYHWQNRQAPSGSELRSVMSEGFSPIYLKCRVDLT